MQPEKTDIVEVPKPDNDAPVTDAPINTAPAANVVPGVFYTDDELDAGGLASTALALRNKLLDSAHGTLSKLGLSADEIETAFNIASPAARAKDAEAQTKRWQENKERAGGKGKPPEKKAPAKK
jgi:hypothetical protein